MNDESDLDIDLNQEQFKVPSLSMYLRISLQSGMTSILDYIQQPILLQFCGRIESNTPLAVNALAMSISNLLVNSPMMGFNNCMDTQMSHAAGKNDSSKVKYYYNLDRIFIIIIFTILFLILQSTPQLLTILNQDETLIAELKEIIWIQGISMLFHAFCDLNNKQMVNLGYAMLPVQCCFIAIIFHIIICYLVIIQQRRGLMGAALCQLATEFFLQILSSSFIFFNNLHDEIFRINIRDLKFEMSFLQLGLQSISQLAIEWWSFELITIMIGSLGKSEITTQALTMILIDLVFMIPYGISSATAYFVGGCTALGETKNAKIYFGQSLLLHSCLIIPIIFILYCNPWLQIGTMTSDESVMSLWSKLQRSWLWILVQTDSFQGILAGSIRGLGMQRKTFYILLIYWIQSVPITYVCVQVWNVDIIEVYMQFNVGSQIHFTGQLIMLVTADWNKNKISKEFFDKCKVKKMIVMTDLLMNSEEQEINLNLLK